MAAGPRGPEEPIRTDAVEMKVTELFYKIHR